MAKSIVAKGWLKKFCSKRSDTEKLLIISSVFSITLVLAKTIMAKELSFVFLPWNLFLAFVPYYISIKLEQRPAWIENKWKFLFVFILWLLFIPNSFYIITDLFHLTLNKVSPRWFDLTMIFSFAWNGLLLGILSVRKIERVVLSCFRIRQSLFFLYPIMWLNALGIYIGRYLRYNSWDVITDPFDLSEDIMQMMIHPFRNIYPWGMIGCFSVFMTILYLSIKKVAESME